MSPLPPLTADRFPAFFEALWGFPPFPWQAEFAARLCAGTPPDYVTVPTGSGKTACLDAAIFALAVQAARPPGERTVGRRIFFIVNRRIIVDEAYERALELRRQLVAAVDGPEGGILTQAARWLRVSAGDETAEPLACAELRGGIYRDRAWAKSLLQPMIVCSTVDQAGSRLLFRGYGVSDEARPIHAALVAQDSLLLLDEAHISQPFVETLGWIKRYRTFQPPGSEVVALPFALICLTATPPPTGAGEAVLLALSEADREHPVLRPRLTCPKLARLVSAPKGKSKQWNEEAAGDLAEYLLAQAKTLLQAAAPRSLAIMVNRVATARAAYELARKAYPKDKVTLLLGRMRPLDRDGVTQELQADLKTARPGQEPSTAGPRRIVISTQCLEVGADFDFDALVTECASLDALRQRFGRLNRGGRPIAAQAVIVLPAMAQVDAAKLTDDKPLDPIYGNAIPRTWAWLQTLATDQGVDFGLTQMTRAVEAWRATNEEALASLLMPVGQAPVLLPAYLDCWVQTNPRPAADPEVALFLHGPQRDMAEVQICWRADLPEANDALAWAETLSLCPPTTLECLPVPLPLAQQWLKKGGTVLDSSGDAPEKSVPLEEGRPTAGELVPALIWRGAEESEMFSETRNLRPGDTLVLRTRQGGWAALGHLPKAPEDPPTDDAAQVDCAEQGQEQMRRRAYVRLHPALWHRGAEDSPTWRLMKWAEESGETMLTKAEVRALLRETAEALGESAVATRLRHLASARDFLIEPYPDLAGVVLSTPLLLPAPAQAGEAAASDDGADDPLLESAEPPTLDAHTQQVTWLAVAFAQTLGLLDFSEALEKAAALHDAGKADRRFQALLLGSDVSAALAASVPLAKSARLPSSRAARERARQRATLPAGFRHEMLSVQLASTAAAGPLLPVQDARRQMALHLIASHHGQARPFAHVVEDDSPPAVAVTLCGTRLALNEAERLEQPAHALDAGIAERFWQLTHLHGWWGLALLEAVLRLADQTASAQPAKS